MHTCVHAYTCILTYMHPHNSLLRRCEQLRIKRVLPPEVAKGVWSAVVDSPHAIDMWSYGCLIHEVCVCQRVSIHPCPKMSAHSHAHTHTHTHTCRCTTAC